MRDRLRAIPVFAAELPGFDPASAPDDPAELFVRWLDHAVEAGVPEPHVVNLATADAAGRVASRFLILKDVGPHGWSFASGSTSPKGLDLDANPHAALACYWPRVGRQIRVSGTVAPEDPQTNAADFLARSPEARAEALVGGQSRPMESPAQHERELVEARERVAREPSLVAPEWTLYTLAPAYVEFWQGDKDRNHIRLRYNAVGDGNWERVLLRP
ncbi:pyridoxine/pyridoxamine 5'-phosphate oxidase [Streptomonospora litoralis]|uniref:Pyridoxine/pyridoxamine 5'-phosphate oxidase n=1 Tax=Streptomonospora litoralis TaxID=2498135 RepID=A0A4P6QB88_9ACTN|nr:pyridoxal 5'-phosphate synthase [Streptomonospora litoralis]QBI56657.1 Pyridoxine/pyridoxamine 5'-phosphate oxidase [Streptomonospora litoralis]